MATHCVAAAAAARSRARAGGAAPRDAAAARRRRAGPARAPARRARGMHGAGARGRSCVRRLNCGARTVSASSPSAGVPMSLVERTELGDDGFTISRLVTGLW